MWRWRLFKRWLGGVRHGYIYKAALESIVSQSSAMARPDAGIWAVELASNALQEKDAHTISATPKLKEAFAFYRQFYKGNPDG